MVSSSASDQAALASLGEAAARTRVERNLSQQELADRAGVGKRTVERFEQGESTTTVNLVRLLRALGLLEELDRIFPAAGPSPLEELRAARKRRRRASPRPATPAAPAGSEQPEPAPIPARRSAARNRAGRPRWGDEQPPT